MNKIPKWLKIVGGAFAALLLLVIIIGASSSTETENSEKPQESSQESKEEPVASRCEDVPNNIVANINEGFNTEGISFRKAQAVKSNDYESVYFVSGDLQGSGLEGEDDFATFATNKLDEVGIYMAVDAVANEFSVFPDGATTDAQLSMSDDGARESLSCLR